MATIDISQLEAFVSVVRSGSFTKAAETMKTQKAHLSRVVSLLEQRLETQLLVRSTRSLSLTEAGRDFFERSVGILTSVEEAEKKMKSIKSEPSGTLRITCGVEFGLVAVNQWTLEYLRQYPKVKVESDFTNRLVDIVHEGFDLAVRVGNLTDSNLQARKIGEINYGIYASPRSCRKKVLNIPGI